MPTIPSIAGANPLPKLPGPTLDRERRPTVDNRNVQAATEQLGRSTRTPELPMSLAENGLENIGQGVARVGNVVTAAAIQEQEATTRVQIHRADNALQTKLAEFDAWRADNPDPLTWQEKWSTMVSPMREQLLADKGLTNRAKEEIALRSETFLARNTAEVTRVSRVAINGEAKKAILGNLRNAVATQDQTAFEGYLAEGAKYLPDYEQKAIRLEFKEEGERQQKQAKADAVDAAANGVTALAKTGGAEVAIKNIRGGMFGKLDATDAENLENQARRVEASARGDLVQGIANKIESGEVKTGARVDELTTNNPLFDDLTKSKLKAFLAEKQSGAIDADREQNGVKNAVALRQAAKDYDPKKDPTGEKYLSMRWEVQQRIPEGLRNSVLDTLEAKANGKTLPVAPGVKGYMDATLDRLFDPVHGAKWRTKRPQQVKETDEKSGKETTVWRDVIHDDPAKQQDAIDERARIEQEVGEFLKENPNAPLDKIKSEIIRRLPAGKRMQNLEAIMGESAATGGLDDDLISTVKGFESFIPNAYGDYKQLSVGYGTRAKSPDEKLTEPEADQRLRAELSMHAGRIDKAAAETGISLTRTQRNALISFDFNTGQGAYLIESSNGNPKEIKRRLVLYTKAGGKELPGLVSRRQKEAAIFDL